MQPYHLAKLVEWAGILNSRKRLQKVVYLLQASGCTELEASYILHHYGPYSFEVANVSDQLVASGIVTETAIANGVGMSYSYEMSEQGRQAVEQLEQGPQRSTLTSFQAFETKARELLQKSIADLEYGSTMLYFYRQTKDWAAAETKTCAFKKLSPNDKFCAAALKLAQEIQQ